MSDNEKVKPTLTSAQVEAQRIIFEQWAYHRGNLIFSRSGLSRKPRGGYGKTQVNSAWKAWIECYKRNKISLLALAESVEMVEPARVLK